MYHQFQPPQQATQQTNIPTQHVAVMARNFFPNENHPPHQQQHQFYYHQNYSVNNQGGRTVYHNPPHHNYHQPQQQFPQKPFYHGQQHLEPGMASYTSNTYQAPYQSNPSVSRYANAARMSDQHQIMANRPNPSVSSGLVENNFQQSTHYVQTPSQQPFSSSATYSVVGNNPSQYGFTSVSTIKHRISREGDSQSSIAKLSQIRRHFSKPINKPAENTKNFNDAIHKAFYQQFGHAGNPTSNVKFIPQTTSLLRHFQKEETKPNSYQQISTQSTQTSVLQLGSTAVTQYPQTQSYNHQDQYIQHAKIGQPQIHQHSQLMQPVSVRVNVSSDDQLMPPPSNFHNASLNSSRVSQASGGGMINSFHTSKMGTPQALPSGATNLSQLSHHSTPSNPPVILSTSITFTPPTNMKLVDQQGQILDATLEPCSQLSQPSLGPPMHNHHGYDTAHILPENMNGVVHQNTSSECPWSTSRPLIAIPVQQILRSPPNFVNTSFVPISAIQEYEPVEKYSIEPSVTLPPQLYEPVVTNQAIPSHSELITNVDEPKTSHDSLIAEINSCRAVSEEVHILTESSEEEEMKEDDSNTVESSHESEQSEVRMHNNHNEFQKAIREALRKARGIVHDVKENSTELLGCKNTRELSRHFKRKTWTNRVTKTRPIIFRRRHYNLKSASNTITGDIIRIIEDKIQKPTSPIRGTSTPSKVAVTPKATILPKKQQTPDLNFLNTPLVSPIPKNFYHQKSNIIPNESDIHEDFHLMNKLKAVKNFYSDGEDWNLDFVSSSQPSSQPSEFSGLINEFM